eukprot:15920-Heterococcus_DN1.PRE.2
MFHLTSLYYLHAAPIQLALSQRTAGVVPRRCHCYIWQAHAPTELALSQHSAIVVLCRCY